MSRLDRPIKPAKGSPICDVDGTPRSYGPISSSVVDPDLGKWSEWFCLPEAGALFCTDMYEVEICGNDRVLRPLTKDGGWWKPHPDATLWRCRFRWPRVKAPPVPPEDRGWSNWYRVVSSGTQFDLEKFEVQFCDPAGNFQPTAETSTAWRCRPRSNYAGKPEFKTKQHGSVAVTTSSGQQWQRLDTCPRGSKVQLMFRFGLPRYEVYTGQPDALAWAPMPDSPEWLKDELSNQNRS